MIYIDTGKRDPAQTLGAWLSKELNGPVAALRFQMGFFGAEALGLFARVLHSLRVKNRVLRVLIGSNDGTTRSSDVEALLRATGPLGSNQSVGIVSFDNAYFHPKTIHIERCDGSSTAYIGSANLTGRGLSLNVEGGILLDTKANDDRLVLNAIASAIDWWFTEPRLGMYPIRSAADLNNLVENHILDVPIRRPVRSGTSARSSDERRSVVLSRLFRIPALSAQVRQAEGRLATETWYKRLSRSDAQRKPTGNQRGSITLVKAGHPIDPQTYFRQVFFKGQEWTKEATRTGQRRETMIVPFDITILGEAVGVCDVMVTHAPNREAGQANYTTLLHLHPHLRPYFDAIDMTEKWLKLERFDNGSYSLSIQDSAP